MWTRAAGLFKPLPTPNSRLGIPKDNGSLFMGNSTIVPRQGRRHQGRPAACDAPTFGIH